jgi:hypothetical protein
VSRTISRISPQHFDDSGELAQRIAFSEACIDHEIGSPTLFPIGGLLLQDRGEFFRRHAWAREDASPLEKCGRGHNEDGIAPPFAAAFEEKRNVEDDDRRTTQPLPTQEALRLLANQRMDDLLEASERIAITEDTLTEKASVDRPFGDGAGEGSIDRAHRAAAVGEQTMHRGIGIVHGDAEAAKHLGGGALPHADRAGEAENLQSVASIVRRSSGVTSGSTPNQAENPGRPWWRSMPRPSIATLPRRLAAARRDVSSGT